MLETVTDDVFVKIFIDRIIGIVVRFLCQIGCRYRVQIYVK